MKTLTLTEVRGVGRPVMDDLPALAYQHLVGVETSCSVVKTFRDDN